MEIPVEILSKCRYYKGEESYTPKSGSQFDLIFWLGESWYCENYANDEEVADALATYNQFFPNQRADSIDPIIKAGLWAATLNNSQFPPEDMVRIFKSKILPAYTASTSITIKS